MSQQTLAGLVEAAATEFGIPGVAVGVWADGREIHACHGVTSVEHPLPVDRNTLYTLGSVTKTYTATALMRLVADGRLALEAPVRRYVPELVLTDEREPTVALRASSLGDAIGVGWFLRDIDGVRAVGHGGSANGQFAELLTAPERDFAVVALSNAGPNGIPFNQAAVRWALSTYLGVIDKDPEPLPYDQARAREVAGAYEIDAMTLTITADGAGLTLEVLIKPEIRAASDTELPADHAPFALGLLPGDEYVITGGAFNGQRGFFTRDDTGEVVGVDLAGRLFGRTAGGRR
jgi:hypothetical protein